MEKLTKALLFLCFPVFLAACQQLNASRVAVDYYAISGNSTQVLDQQIRKKGPRISGGRHAVAVARIRIIPNIKYRPTGDGCRVSHAKVNVDARVTLPRWTGRENASKELGEAWDNIDRYTRMHEAVHVAIAFRFAKRMEDELSTLRSTQNCQALNRKAERIVARYLREHDETQRQFDEDEQRKLLAFARSSKTDAASSSGG
ncbi:MAG: DUF922 domain-containing protein [Ahrensia sp.]|nr:DUF922 domain-containing protein [Ahrensia sp.]